MFEIWYQPRIQDELCVARFGSMGEAEAYMEVIKSKNPKAYEHHWIKQDIEHGGPKGLEPTRYNTWETKGREIDFQEGDIMDFLIWHGIAMMSIVGISFIMGYSTAVLIQRKNNRKK